MGAPFGLDAVTHLRSAPAGNRVMLHQPTESDEDWGTKGEHTQEHRISLTEAHS